MWDQVLIQETRGGNRNVAFWTRPDGDGWRTDAGEMGGREEREGMEGLKEGFEGERRSNTCKEPRDQRSSSRTREQTSA